jgi:GDPmannose 4,6-dehydratase
MVKSALITGITGQDGAYLARFLLNKGYKVFGTYRRVSTPNFWRLQYLDVLNKIYLIPSDISDMSSLLEAVSKSDPDEIYHLAAQSYVGASFDQPLYTTEVDGAGSLRILEIIRHLKKDIKFYQASTSELYGDTNKAPQNESTPFNPSSPYAAAKLLAFHLTKIYRKAYGIFACNGILFNHESPLRGLEFVTRKITNAVAQIKLGLLNELRLGNLNTKRDWGYAEDYVEGMWMILKNEKPDDFVMATGETHSVKEFAEEAFRLVNLNWIDYVKVDKRLIRPADVNLLQGNNTKAKKIGWKPKTSFKELVKLMVNEDLNRWKRYLKGELFPWDALSYPTQLNLIKRYGRI